MSQTTPTGSNDTGPKRAIFRAQALQEYVDGRDQIVPPLYATPPSFAVMWATVASLIAAGLLVAFAYLGHFSGADGWK